MNEDLTIEQKERKKYIELFVDKLYTRFNYLFTDTLDVVKQKAMDKYLNSSLSITEITDDMVRIIEDMKKEYDRKQREAAEKKIDEMPVTAVVEQTTNHEELPVTNQEEMEEVEVVHIPVTAPSAQPAWQTDNTPNYADVKFSGILRKTDDYSDSSLTKTEGRKVPDKTSDGSIVVDELNNMLEEKPKEEKTENTNDLEKPKQFVKTNNNADNGNDSKGFVSLFNIILSILAIAGIVLVAMILNVLLK